MSDRTLAATIELLEAAYETSRQSLARQNVLDPFASQAAPEETRDSNGRYILLDALTAIVQAKATLARIEAPVEALVVRPGDTLIMRLDRGTSPETCQRIEERIEPELLKRVPSVGIVWLGGVEEIVAYRPDEDAQT